MLIKYQNVYPKMNGVYLNYSTPPVPTLTSYSGILTLPRNGTFANGFNGLGSIWSRGAEQGTEYYQEGQFGGKSCADVRSKTLKVDITGTNVSFNIINWYRTNSDFNGTANYNVLLTNEQTTWQFPNPIRNVDLVAFGDISPIYMTWSAVYPVGENVDVSGKILGVYQTMFKYYGENEIVAG